MRAVNLIPAEQRSGQQIGAGRSQGGAYAVLLVIAGLALMAYLYGSADHQIASRHTQIASLTAQARQEQSAAERLAPYTSFIALREQRMQTVETLINSRFDWAHVFHEFGRVLPSGVSISSLDGKVGAASSSGGSSSSSSSGAGAGAGASASSATPPGSVPTFTVAGCATSQPTVALLLQRLRLIDGAASVTLQSSTASGAGSGGGVSTGPCPANGPVFSVEMTFDPLPSTAAALSAATKAGAKSASNSVSPSSSSTSTGSGLQ